MTAVEVLTCMHVRNDHDSFSVCYPGCIHLSAPRQTKAAVQCFSMYPPRVLVGPAASRCQLEAVGMIESCLILPDVTIVVAVHPAAKVIKHHRA
jgi:hypothetical protein